MYPLPILTHEYVLYNPPRKPPSPYSVCEYLFEEIKNFGKAKALVHSLTNESMSFDDVIRDTVKVAEGLRRKGVGVGDVVGVCSENRLEYAPVVLGILACGATCCPLNPIYIIDELVHILNISRPKVIFCSPFVFNKIEDCRSRISFIEDLILFDATEPAVNFTPYQTLKNNPRTRETFSFPRINLRENVAFLFCSSGTTGLPKCVELTHFNFTHLLDFFKILWENEPSDLVTLGLIPFFHGYGCSILLASLLTKTLNVVMMRFDEENFLASIERYKITHLFLVPPLVVFLSKHPLVEKYNLSSVRKVTCGAAPLSQNTQLAAQKRLKLKEDIKMGYGMTELSIVCAAFQGEKGKIGASGTIVPGMECKVVDTETGKALPPYERGEICFRGPFVMKGYRRNPEATRSCFDAQGWFHTGDIAYYDSDGFLFVVDRLKELIKYKGFQVPPAELEGVLINHPAIKEAGVIGVPDEEAGELPMAFVVLQPGARLTEKEVQDYVAGKVSPQKRLHGGVRFLEEIPKNPSGKILRRELRQLLHKSKL